MNLPKPNSEEIKVKIKSRSKVDKRTGCWNWTSYKNESGYGKLFYSGFAWRAHRLSYIGFVGKIKAGLFVCHKCDNKSCVNPDHLFVGTNQDNIDDLVRKGKHWRHGQTHCKHGHELTKENTYIYDGDRYCIMCRNIRSLRCYENKKVTKYYLSLFQ